MMHACAQEYNVHSNRSTVAVTAGDKAFIHWYTCHHCCVLLTIITHCMRMQPLTYCEPVFRL